LWDGSIVHGDILSNRILGTVKAHGKYVSSIATDGGRGVVVSASPVQLTGHVAIWRGWRADFLREREPSVEWIGAIARSTAENHGTSVPAQRLADRLVSPRIVAGRPDDLVGEARAVREYDDLRAADLLAEAVASGRGAELSPDERGLAGQALLAIDAEGGLALLHEAARAGSADAHVAIGLHLVRGTRTDAGWEAALPHFLDAAERGHAHAAYLLGYYHDRIERGLVGSVNWRSIAMPTGASTEPDRRGQLARKWYQRAAAAGSEPARQRLVELAGETGDTSPTS
jgi:hypothetical protein